MVSENLAPRWCFDCRNLGHTRGFLVFDIVLPFIEELEQLELSLWICKLNHLHLGFIEFEIGHTIEFFYFLGLWCVLTILVDNDVLDLFVGRLHDLATLMCIDKPILLELS